VLVLLEEVRGVRPRREVRSEPVLIVKVVLPEEVGLRLEVEQLLLLVDGTLDALEVAVLEDVSGFDRENVAELLIVFPDAEDAGDR